MSSKGFQILWWAYKAEVPLQSVLQPELIMDLYMWRKGLIVICNKPKLERDNLRSEKLLVCHRELVMKPENDMCARNLKPTSPSFPIWGSPAFTTLTSLLTCTNQGFPLSQYLLNLLPPFHAESRFNNRSVNHAVTHSQGVSWKGSWFLQHRNFSGYRRVLKTEMVFLVQERKGIWRPTATPHPGEQPGFTWLSLCSSARGWRSQSGRVPAVM